MASDFFMPTLNHSSLAATTIVQGSVATIATMVGNTYQQRLNEAMEEAGVGTSALAERLGVSYQAVRKAQDGRTKSLSAANNAAAAAMLGVLPDWLATGAGPKHAAKPTTIEPTPGSDTQGKPFQNVESVGLERFRRVPLIGWVQAGMLTEFSDPFPVGIADDYELVDIEYGRRTVALRIKNDSMEPDFREGDIIIVDPDLAPRPGDFVVAKNHVEEATFKKYRPRGTAQDGSLVFELAPLNDDYPTLRSDVDHLRIVGVMIEHRRRMRR
jgi:SOS-response transcriptional repressor LexA